jgi:hypothetical protein
MQTHPFWQTHRPEELYAWCLSQPDLVEKYKGQVVLLHGRSVVGSGLDALEAWADAQRRAATENRFPPPIHELLQVSVPEHLWFDGEFYDPQEIP